MATRWGLLGCGDIANKRVASAIQSDPLSSLVAACRRDETKLEEFGGQFEVPFLTTSADELFSSSDIDAIYVATPVHLHCQQTIAAAEAGKHVLVEKPMALAPSECKRMIEACDANQVTLGVAYYRRFYPTVLRAKEILLSGDLGRPLSILATTGNNTRFPKEDWRVVKSHGGGGPLMDIGSHRLDLFLQLMGDIVNVDARCASSPHYEAEDVATVLVEFANGCHGVLQSYFGTLETPDRLEVIGTDGRITIESLNDDLMTIVDKHGVRHESYPTDENLHAPLVSDFTSAIQDGRPPVVTGQIGKKTNDLIEKAYLSAAS